MPQYMKKGFGRMVTADGESDPELSEVRYTADEYRELKKKISELKRKLEAEQEIHKQDVESIRAKAVQYKNDIVTEAEKRIEQAQELLETVNVRKEAVEVELDRERKLNENLLRITRERANAKRGIQPKKEGYNPKKNDQVIGSLEKLCRQKRYPVTIKKREQFIRKYGPQRWKLHMM